MDVPLHVFLLTLVTLSLLLSSSSSSSLSPSSSSSSSSLSSYGLTQGSSLSVENKDDVLVSSNGLFTAGFHQVGENAYGFAIWFSEHATYGTRTIVWMANRDAPVNGKHSKLCLQEDGNLVLMDAGKYVIWSTHTKSTSHLAMLQLRNTGNLVLDVDDGGGQSTTLWQSFDYPTDTLLPNQLFTKSTQLVSSRSSTNYSSGFYKLFFDNDSILRLLYNGLDATTVFWPDPVLRSWEVGRFQYQYNHKASLDSHGEFNSSDGLNFKSADFGKGPQRIMKIDIDGNVRVYSLVVHKRRMRWEVQWQALSQSCKIHGICGPNSVCSISQDSGRKCSCVYGYKRVKLEDWSYGCEPDFHVCIQDDCDFIELHQVDFYGYDIRFIHHVTLDACKKNCLHDDACMGFQFGWKEDTWAYYCFIKSSLRNGFQVELNVKMHIKLPKKLVSSYHEKIITQSNFSCARPMLTPIIRSYKEKHDTEAFRYMLTFGCGIGCIEIICIMIFWCYSSKRPSTNEQSYFPAAIGFRKFTYRELKKASCNFSQEIGRGGACIVYKGKLSDNRIAAIKKLKITNHQGEAEFQAEINTIGRVNHMNLIETWGYCIEGKHRLVVYEYMENGSLAENLETGKLDWATRLDIAKGTAKGLAYLHEECLEWVLHCDVKPHNILLDANYNPKVADFGLSKLFNRGGFDHSSFSMIRGTRGYMAPEWVFNLPVTSKVDVYSYGMVILEMITGRNLVGKRQASNGNEEVELALVEWVRDKIQTFNGSHMASWVEEIVDPSVSGKYDITTMENLVRIALQCVEEDSKARPSMSQVVNIFLHV
ncbi:hypothetical protein OSB04_005082 [Centaurea solstitialis]|uniref:Receptor-like serine/threonine-protein kinase n=1 Tax=Centaurea solstitialis TaxID=347529 RepID=A0AA38WGG2_9ASTR|nr:hypothetical protein OSB04_005082 [Centaurea solstitialis]